MSADKGGLILAVVPEVRTSVKGRYDSGNVPVFVCGITLMVMAVASEQGNGWVRGYMGPEPSDKPAEWTFNDDTNSNNNVSKYRTRCR